jgi:hypothetical protein
MRFLAILLAVMSGCTTLDPNDDAADFGKHLLRVNQRMNECAAEWGALYAEWKRNGGGVQASMNATRAQVRTDRRSRLSRWVRQAWAAQRRAQSTIPAAEAYAATQTEAAYRNVTFAIYDAVHAETGCDGMSNLQELLWYDVAQVNAGSIQIRSLQEMPEALGDDGHLIRNWLFFGLLADIEAQSP